jgi:hypothetical protein
MIELGIAAVLLVVSVPFWIHEARNLIREKAREERLRRIYRSMGGRYWQDW